MGSADDTFTVLTHLSADAAGMHALEAGDMLLGYDLRRVAADCRTRERKWSYRYHTCCWHSFLAEGRRRQSAVRSRVWGGVSVCPPVVNVTTAVMGDDRGGDEDVELS